jgi:hypothetical protein
MKNLGVVRRGVSVEQVVEMGRARQKGTRGPMIH